MFEGPFFHSIKKKNEILEGTLLPFETHFFNLIKKA